MNSCPKVGGSHNGSVKIIRIIAALLLCCLAPRESAAQSPAQAGLLDFIATHRDRHFDGVPHEVLAFYYTWYGRPERQDHWVHWVGRTRRTIRHPRRRIIRRAAPTIHKTRPWWTRTSWRRKAAVCPVSLPLGGDKDLTKTAVLRSCWPARSKKISKPASIGKPRPGQAANKLTGQSPTWFMCFRVMARTGRF